MIAYEIPSQRFSLPAGGAVKRHRFVSVNSSGNGIAATAETVVVGVSMNQVASGEVLEAADGILMVEASAAITAGVAVAATTDGKAVAYASGTTGAAYAVALTGATAAGELITVKL